MQLWIHNSTGAINAGDQQPGERPATPQEIDNWMKYQTLTPNTEEIKIKALSIIRELRKEKEYSGCISQGILWDTDEKSERRLTSAVTLMKDAQLPAIPNFKPSEDISITLTLEIATQAGMDMMIHYGKCFAWEDSVIIEINKCNTIEQIRDIVNSL